MANGEIEFLNRIKKDIEEKLFFEQRALKTRDLKYIAEYIEDKSDVTLSLSTLKRIWKDDFSQTPQPSTLNALAAILDYGSWQDYKNQKTPIPKIKNASKPRSWKLNLGMLILLCIPLFWFLIQKFNSNQTNSLKINGTVLFSANKTVSEGVPNTVIFNYDVSEVEADSFFIQQSWNDKEKVQIDPLNDVFSSVYYTPSFHHAKLIANDSIIATHDIHIKSVGWMPYVKYNSADRIPIYFSDKTGKSNGSLEITKNDLETAGVNLSKDYILRYVNIRNFEEIDQNNFSLQTKIKNEKITDIVCPFSELLLVFEDGIYWVQFMQKGCEGDGSLKVGEKYLNGRQNDLSMFGTDVFDWQLFEMNTVNKLVNLKLNGEDIYTIEYEANFGNLVGIIYSFKGGGSVDYVTLKDIHDTVIYEDQFD